MLVVPRSRIVTPLLRDRRLRAVTHDLDNAAENSRQADNLWRRNDRIARRDVPCSDALPRADRGGHSQPQSRGTGLVADLLHGYRIEFELDAVVRDYCCDVVDYLT